MSEESDEKCCSPGFVLSQTVNRILGSEFLKIGEHESVEFGFCSGI